MLPLFHHAPARVFFFFVLMDNGYRKTVDLRIIDGGMGGQLNGDFSLFYLILILFLKFFENLNVKIIIKLLSNIFFSYHHHNHFCTYCK